MIEMTDILLYSGGLDSLIAWEFLQRPRRFYAALNHRYEAAEKAAMRNVEATIKQADRPVVDACLNLGSWEKDNANIPARNLLMAISAARFARDVMKAKNVQVWLIAQKDEMYVADKTPEFMHNAGLMLTEVLECEVRVSTPFEEMDKTDMVAWWLEKKLPVDRLVASSSCYKPVALGNRWVACGNCAACLRRYIAFRLNGIEGAQQWHQPPPLSEQGLKYVDRARAGDFSPQRCERTLSALVQA